MGWLTRSLLAHRLPWLVAACAALVLPAGAMWQSVAEERAQRSQQPAPEVELPASKLATYRSMRTLPAPSGPLVLSYHDIREGKNKSSVEKEDIYTVTPRRLAEHLVMLRTAGFVPVTSGQVAAWLDGGTLPRRSVLLTFDDGTAGIWRHADRILERYGFHGTAFIITGRVGTKQPYYLTWDQIGDLTRSGRWDLGSHTRLGHDRVATTAGGKKLPFLINCLWIEEEGRRETPVEALLRVRADLDASRRDLSDHGVKGSLLFAYPFSAETRPTNAPELPARVAAAIADRFAGALSNDEPDRFVSERDRSRRSMSRIEVFGFTTADGLYQRILHARPLPVGRHVPFASSRSWVDSSGRPLARLARGPATGAFPSSPIVDQVAWGKDRLTLSPTERYSAVSFAPGRTEDWHGYRTEVTVAGLEHADTTASLTVLSGGRGEVVVSVSDSYIRVRHSESARSLADQRLPTAGARRIQVDARRDRVVVRSDGQVIVDTALPEGGTGGIGLGASSQGPVTFAEMRVSPLP